MYNLAQLLEETGDLQAAAPLFHEELRGCGTAYGEQHPQTLSSARNLVRLLTDAMPDRVGEAQQIVARYRLLDDASGADGAAPAPADANPPAA